MLHVYHFLISTFLVNLPVVIMSFKTRDASGERRYLITASNLTELTLTLNKSSKNVLLKCSFIRFTLYYSSFYSFYFYLPHNNYKKYSTRTEKKSGAETKQKLQELMRGQATSNQGLELFHITELKKRWREVEDGKIYDCFHTRSIM